MIPKASFRNISQQATGIIPYVSRDCSTNKLQRTLILKFGSHYNFPDIRRVTSCDLQVIRLYASLS